MTDMSLPSAALARATRKSAPVAVAVAVGVHCVIWTFGPALVLGNLHSDTLEAAYWGRAWAWGYDKHPPLTTWLFDLALRTNLQPIFALMALSQLTVAASAYFVWRTARLYASRETAALAVTLYLVAPAASIYAVQINHNSIMVPFAAATLFYGLRYLERRRWTDALALALAAALGVLAKYENTFLLATLLGLALIVPRFKPAFHAPASYVCVATFALLLVPHVLWLQANHWPSAARALGYDKITSAAAFVVSAANSLVGVFTALCAPYAVLWLTRRRRTPEPAVARDVGLGLAYGPLLVMFLAGAATYQIIKPLWVIPLATAAAVGLALLHPAGPEGRGLAPRVSATIAVGWSALVFAGFLLFLFIAGAIGKPFSAYSPDTQALARDTQAFWASRRSGPLACLVTGDRKIGASGVLWLPGRPDVVDASSPSWRTPAQIAACRRTGGVAVLAADADPTLDLFPGACRDEAGTVTMPAVTGSGRGTWAVRLVIIPPDGEDCDAPLSPPAKPTLQK